MTSPKPATGHNLLFAFRRCQALGQLSAAVLDDRGRFLAIRRADNGQWEPPGGVLELGEAIDAGLVREVEEETGFRVTPVALTGVYKNMRCGIVALLFRCELVAEGVPLTNEAREVRWLTGDIAHRYARWCQPRRDLTVAASTRTACGC